MRLSLSPIHNHDLMSIRGLYGTKPSLPAAGGTEAAGVVDVLGDGVANVKIGQRVMIAGMQGLWSDVFVTRADRVMPLPDAIDDSAGCQLVAMPSSSLLLLDDAALAKGEWLAQNAANGAVGKAVAKIAQQRGINVLNVVRRSDAVAELEALGIANAVATDQPKWWERAKAITGGAPVLVGVDSVGGASSNANRSPASGRSAISQSPLEWTMRAVVGEVMRLVATGVLSLTVDASYALADFKRAIAAHAKPGRGGKIAFKP